MTSQLAASTSSGSAGAVGILQAILQARLQGVGPVGYCPKVLKGVIFAGCCARCLLGVLFQGVLFLAPRSWVLCLLLARLFILGRFVPGSSFLGVVLAACQAFYSRAFCSWLLVPRYCACYLLDVLFLDPRSWILYLLLAGHFTPRSWCFVPGSSFRS